MPISLRLFFAITLSLVSTNARAQFWHALPPMDAAKTIVASFSHDEKKVFYISNDAGISNIYAVAVKGGAPVQVTKFNDHGVERAFHLLNKPEIVFMRALDAAGKDYHLYRMKDDGTGEMLDVTKAPAGVSNTIIGISYNGRFIYYTSNKVTSDKWDVYRYDVMQNATDLIMPNDKDYRVVSWSRDQSRLLMEDPASGELSVFDIASTERTSLAKPVSGKYLHAIMDPTNHELFVYERTGEKKLLDLSTKSWKEVKELNASIWKEVSEGEVSWIDYSPNGKYMIVKSGAKWAVREFPTSTEIPLPAGAQPVAISPKETMLVFASPVDSAHSKLMLYDIAKKTSVELATVVNP